MLPVALCRGQDDVFSRYAEEQEMAFSRYVDKASDDFKAYNDSINREFARYLAEAWRDFDLTLSEPPIKTPVPLSVYTPEPASNPDKQPRPIIDAKPEPADAQEESIPNQSDPEPVSNFVERDIIEVSFYGSPVSVKKVVCSLPSLVAVDERSVAYYWTSLSRLPYRELVANVDDITRQLQLNDWGRYLAINMLFNTYFPGRSSSEQTVFAVFMLNQCGYRARIGRADRLLLPLIAFDCEVFNSMYFNFGSEAGGIRYYVINTGHAELRSVESCRMEYAGALKSMDMSLPVAPKLSPCPVNRTLHTTRGEYSLQFDMAYARMLATYPCVDMRIYAEAAVSDSFVQGLGLSLKAAVEGLTQREATGVLLDVVQNGFGYKTDGEQFGYERWFFPEETIASQYCDCEDRSFLFIRLVRQLLGLDAVLIYYPGKHVATAVYFNEIESKDDCVSYAGKKYVICDPTYIGAPPGMEMPGLGNKEVMPVGEVLM